MKKSFVLFAVIALITASCAQLRAKNPPPTSPVETVSPSPPSQTPTPPTEPTTPPESPTSPPTEDPPVPATVDCLIFKEVELCTAWTIVWFGGKGDAPTERGGLLAFRVPDGTKIFSPVNGEIGWTNLPTRSGGLFPEMILRLADGQMMSILFWRGLGSPPRHEYAWEPVRKGDLLGILFDLEVSIVEPWPEGYNLLVVPPRANIFRPWFRHLFGISLADYD